MAESQTSGQQIAAAEHRLQALALRKQGHTFQQIGALLGVSRQRAHQLVSEELADLRTACAETAADLIRLQEERLDALLLALWPYAIGQVTTFGPDGKAAKSPAPPDLDAVGKVVKLLERLAALRGLDSPKKVAPTNPDGTEPWKVYAGFNPEDV